MLNLFLVLFMIFSGLYVYSVVQEHLLSVLLSLEFMVLGVFMLMQMIQGDFFIYSLIYLLMTACEGALGLSILVMMSRTHGGDFLKIFNLN